MSNDGDLQDPDPPQIDDFFLEGLPEKEAKAVRKLLMSPTERPIVSPTDLG